MDKNNVTASGFERIVRVSKTKMMGYFTEGDHYALAVWEPMTGKFFITTHGTREEMDRLLFEYANVASVNGYGDANPQETVYIDRCTDGKYHAFKVVHVAEGDDERELGDRMWREGYLPRMGGKLVAFYQLNGIWPLKTV